MKLNFRSNPSETLASNITRIYSNIRAKQADSITQNQELQNMPPKKLKPILRLVK